MKIKNLFPCMTLATLAACSGMPKEAALDFPQPTLQDSTVQWIYSERISDEFDGESIDTTKWYDYNPTWTGRQPSLFRPENVRVEDGKLILSGKREELRSAPEGYHTFSSAAVQSKHKVLYGFFEIKFRPMKSALSSAFWLYTQDKVKQEEIDIFEICGRHDTDSVYPRTYFATSHFILKEKSTQISDNATYKIDKDWADVTSVAGLEWTRDSIKWYVDGKLIRSRKNDFWHSPETVNFDSEAFPTWWGLPSETDNGGEFVIDYFRYWSHPQSQEEMTIFENDMK